MLEEQGLECPKCNKFGLVRCQHSDHDVFQCLYCGHRHDLTKAYEKTTSSSSGSSGEMGIWLTALIAGLFLVFGLILP